MLNISNKTKQIYKTDRYPYRTEPINKEFYIKVVDTGTIIGIENMETESFKLNESICSDTDLRLGACESSAISFVIYDFNEDLKSKWIEVFQIVEGENVPFGKYRVSTINKLNNPMWKEVVAYDRMVDADVDVVDWFNKFWADKSQSTVKEMRTSLLDHLGFTYIEQPLINDDMLITKTIDPEQILARYVLEKIGEVNASFGHFSRKDEFRYVSLLGEGPFPSETLYPAHDLYPTESGECITDGKAVYFADESKYAEYIVQPIDSIQFNAREGKNNTVISETKEYYNPYIIEENFLLYDKNEAQLQAYGKRIFNAVKEKYYVPADISIIGLPYLEVGDSLYMEVGGDMITTFVFERELTGMVSLNDRIIARGNEWRNNFQDIKTQMLILKEQSESYTDDMLEVATDEIAGLSAQLEVVKGSITGIVSGQAPMWDTGNYEISYSGKGLPSTNVDDFIDVHTNDYYLDFTNGKVYKAKVSGNEVSWTYVLTGASYLGEISGELALKIDKDDDGRIVALISGSAHNIAFNASNMFTVNAPNLAIDSLGNVTATNFHALKKLYLKNSLVGNEVSMYVDDGGTRPSLIVDAYEMEIGRGSVVVNTDLYSYATIDLLNDYAKKSSISGFIKGIDVTNSGDGAKKEGYSSVLYWSSSSGGTKSSCNAYHVWLSDERKKEYITDVSNIENAYLNLRPVHFKFKDDVEFTDRHWHYGYLAQEVEKAFNNANVSTQNESLVGYDEENDSWLLDKNELHAMHTYMIQKQQKEIDSLKSELSEIKSLLKEKGVIE